MDIYVLWKWFWNLKIDKITFQTGVYILYSTEISAAMGLQKDDKNQSIESLFLKLQLHLQQLLQEAKQFPLQCHWNG